MCFFYCGWVKPGTKTSNMKSVNVFLFFTFSALGWFDMLHMGLLLPSAYLISGPIWTSYPKKLMFLYIYLQFQVSNLHIHDQQQMDCFFHRKGHLCVETAKKTTSQNHSFHVPPQIHHHMVHQKKTPSFFRCVFVRSWDISRHRHQITSPRNVSNPIQHPYNRVKLFISTAWGVTVTSKVAPALASPTNTPPALPVGHPVPWPRAMDDSTTTTFGPSGDAAAASTLVTYGAANVGETTLSSCALEEVYQGCFSFFVEVGGEWVVGCFFDEYL